MNETENILTIPVLQKDIHKNAVNKGWYETERPLPELLCLVHSEVSEALEEYRVGNFDKFAEELADVVIRVMDMSEYMNIDLQDEILKKMKKNLARPYRHGNKKC